MKALVTLVVNLCPSIGFHGNAYVMPLMCILYIYTSDLFKQEMMRNKHSFELDPKTFISSFKKNPEYYLI